jgi:hypothetical protein
MMLRVPYLICVWLGAYGPNLKGRVIMIDLCHSCPYTASKLCWLVVRSCHATVLPTGWLRPRPRASNWLPEPTHAQKYSLLLRRHVNSRYKYLLNWNESMNWILLMRVYDLHFLAFGFNMSICPTCLGDFTSLIAYQKPMKSTRFGVFTAMKIQVEVF